jgi:hypothetical protein
MGFTGCGKTQPRGFVTRARLYRLRKNSTKGLCNKGMGFTGCGKTQSRGFVTRARL